MVATAGALHIHAIVLVIRSATLGATIAMTMVSATAGLSGRSSFATALRHDAFLRRRSASSWALHAEARTSAPPPSPETIIALPPAFKERTRDATSAISAVLAACRITHAVQPAGRRVVGNDGGGASKNDGGDNGIRTLTKEDASPVTVGDFASQAVALRALRDAFPSDVLLAEEGSDALRSDDDLCRRVSEALRRGDGGDKEKSRSLSSWENDGDIWTAIDLGRHGTMPVTSSSGSEMSTNDGVGKTRRIWCLDPIDGTKGFLRGKKTGGQYCVALALIEDGVPTVGVLGCPNLPLENDDDDDREERGGDNATGRGPYGAWSKDEIETEESGSQLFSPRRGCLFVAVRGCGCYEIPLHALSLSDGNAASAWTNLRVAPNDGTSKRPSDGIFCLGVERGFSDPGGTILRMAEVVHGHDALTEEKDGLRDIRQSVRMDGQGKYGLLSRGRAEYFCRLPKDGYVDWVWDVAAGYVVLTEAGGMMTDVYGREVDFSSVGVDGRAKLQSDVRGLFGSNGGVFHEALVKAYGVVQKQHNKEKI